MVVVQKRMKQSESEDAKQISTFVSGCPSREENFQFFFFPWREIPKPQ